MTDSQADSQSESLLNTQNQNTQSLTPPDIPIEIVSEEEMALIDSALAAARYSTVSPSCSSLFRGNVRSIQSITVLSKRSFSGCNELDVEDLGHLRMTHKKKRVPESLLNRFRKNRGLFVTDITSTEWCEKQMEFHLLFGERKVTRAMKAGIARHAKLEEEVIQKVTVHTNTIEDNWAIKLMNFITGANQLFFEGLTRELPLIGFVDGVWIVGVIDEIRMPVEETSRSPLLVETKTRAQGTFPAEAQRRNGRLQLMCYKYLWDNLVAGNFPSSQFFDFFSLKPHCILSEEIRDTTANAGFPAETLEEMVKYFRNACSMLPLAHNQLLLRYELQQDNSVLGEDKFEYDSDFLKTQIHTCLEFWRGEREASYTAEEERWKCRYCQFASVCPANSDPDAKSSSSTKTKLDNDTSCKINDMSGGVGLGP